MGKSENRHLVTARPEKPIRYGLFARTADRRAGRVDGKAAVLSTVIDRTGAACATPYLAALDRRYRTQAELVRLRVDHDIAPMVARRITVERQIMSVEADVAQIQQRLADFPETAPDEVLSQRNGIEQAADPELIRTRNQREWDARRQPLLAEERRARDAIRELWDEEAQLTGAVTARERIGATRARRLHEHALRRIRTYERHLSLSHPDGAALLRLLELVRPELPEWARFNSRLADSRQVAL